MEPIVIVLFIVGAAYGLSWCLWIKRTLDRERAERQTHRKP